MLMFVIRFESASHTILSRIGYCHKLDSHDLIAGIGRVKRFDCHSAWAPDVWGVSTVIQHGYLLC